MSVPDAGVEGAVVGDVVGIVVGGVAEDVIVDGAGTVEDAVSGLPLGFTPNFYSASFL